MEKKFTKGEWSYFYNEEGSFTIASNLDKDGEVILGVVFPPEVKKDTLDLTQAEANAKLIAAAPDLLEAARLSLKSFGTMIEINNDDIRAIEKLKAAIKKAI